MQYPLSPDAGREFTKLFYGNLRAGMTVAQAVHAARRRATVTYRLGGPILYLRGQDGILVPDSPPRSPATNISIAGEPGSGLGSATAGSTRLGATLTDQGSRRMDQGSRPVSFTPPPPLGAVALTAGDLWLHAKRAAGRTATNVDAFLADVERLWAVSGPPEGDSLEATQLGRAVEEWFVSQASAAHLLAWSELRKDLGGPQPTPDNDSLFERGKP